MKNTARPTVTKKMTASAMIFAGLCALLIVVAGLLVLGAYAPAIPYLGAFGSAAVSLWPAWLVVLPLVGAFIIWRTNAGPVRKALLLIGGLAALGAANVIRSVLSVAWANDVTVSIGAPFGFTGALAEVKPDEVTSYTKDAGETLGLRIYRPKGRAPSGGWPVLMYVHGGGWVEGSSAQRSADMRWFADHGWVTVSVDYGLSSDTRHMWNRVHGQIGCAMAWTGANISQRGGDPRRLAMIGDSAGGNLVINASYMANASRLTSVCGGSIPKVTAVSAMYPGVDLAAAEKNTYRPTGPDVRSMVQRYIGGTAAQFPNRFAATGSASYINAAAPPTLLFVSESDHLVPPDSVRQFAKQASDAGTVIRTVSVPFAEHVFDATGIGNSIVRQVTLQFIDKHAEDQRS
jgi:acetyl esterase